MTVAEDAKDIPGNPQLLVDGHFVCEKGMSLHSLRNML